MSVIHGRRSFISAVASLAGVAAALSPRRRRACHRRRTGRKAARDISWLDQLKGSHKQLYNLGSHDLASDPRPLRFARNFLDTFRDVYRLEFPDINTAVGISGPAFPMNASDRLWAKYRLGERSNIVDPMTKQPAVRNLFLDGPDVERQGHAGAWRRILAVQCGTRRGGTAARCCDADARGGRASGPGRRTESGRQADAITRNGTCARSGARLHIHEAVTRRRSRTPASSLRLKRRDEGHGHAEALIIADPFVLGGKACVRGTRLSVEFLLELAASGATQPEILRQGERTWELRITA